MHSLAMAEDILKVALNEAERHHARKIKAISVKVGDKYFAESDSLQFCLKAVTNWTIAEGARIEIDTVDANDGGNPEMPTGEEPLEIELELD